MSSADYEIIPEDILDLMVNEYEGQSSADHMHGLLCEVVKSHKKLKAGNDKLEESERYYKREFESACERISYREEVIENMKGLLKDHENDWKRIQEAERKCASLEEECRVLRSAHAAAAGLIELSPVGLNNAFQPGTRVHEMQYLLMGVYQKMRVAYEQADAIRSARAKEGE